MLELIIILFIIFNVFVLFRIFNKGYFYDLTLFQKISLYCSQIIIIVIIAFLTHLAVNYVYHDVKYVSGKVQSKDSEHVSCEHRYQCGSVCNGKGVCTPIYCHRHSYDIDWNLQTSIGVLKIDREDSRGTTQPKNWTSFNIGDTVTAKVGWSNPVLKDIEESPYYYYTNNDTKDIPDIPKITQEYRFNPTINKTQFDSTSIENKIIDWIGTHDLNVFLIIVDNETPEYVNTFMNKWKSPKVNDIILFYDIDKDNDIVWFNAITFAKNKNNFLLIEKLKTNALNNKLNLEQIETQLTTINDNFNRFSEDDLDSIKPISNIGMLAMFIVSFIWVCYLALIEYFIRENF